MVGNQALYLKWRPQTFEDVIGQEHITTALRNSLRQGRVRHAYLFSGPRGTGKTTTARLLAKAVNCLEEDVDRRPCNVCHNCLAVMAGRLFDLIEIDAASHTGVDDVRDLRDKIAFSPSEGKYKVYIIDEVHRFSGAAFDALLKTLEEPPPHAIFVLATTEIEKVPATIKSRCLLFEFRRVSVRQVVERLQMICDDEGISIEPAALELIARQGTGSVRDSISLLDQVLADPARTITLELARNMLGAVNTQAVMAVAQAIIEQNAPLALHLLNEAMDMGADPRQFGHQLVDHLRQVMLVQIGGVDLVDASDEMRAIFADQAQRISKNALMKAITHFNDAVNDVRGGWQPQLPLELAIVESTQTPAEAPSVSAQVAARVEQPPRQAASEQPAQASQPSAPSGVTLGEIQKRWGDLKNVRRLKESKSNVKALLEHCKPLRLHDNVLYVGIGLEHLKSKLERDLDILVDTIADVFGVRFVIHVETISQGQMHQHATDDPVEAEGLELGGKIIDLD